MLRQSPWMLDTISYCHRHLCVSWLGRPNLNACAETRVVGASACCMGVLGVKFGPPEAERDKAALFIFRVVSMGVALYVYNGRVLPLKRG